jgi:hypothetical protein
MIEAWVPFLASGPPILGLAPPVSERLGKQPFPHHF